MDKVSVVIPVYRGVETLEMLCTQIHEVLGENLSELIFVYDCGNHASWDMILKLSQAHSKVIGVHLSRNFGQHNATICGFAYATGDYIVTMDEDLQHNPRSIPLLLQTIKNNNSDLIYGKYNEKKHSGFRNVTSRMLAGLLSSGIPDLHPDYSAFRIIRSSIAMETLSMRNSYTFLDGYITWITSRVGSVPVPHSESEAGESSYTFKKLAEHSINIFVTFSNLPIRLLTYFATGFFVVSTLYSIYILINTFLFDDYLAGFPTLIVVLGFGFGFTLLGLGIIGEYIQRINLKTTNRPNYSVREVINEPHF